VSDQQCHFEFSAAAAVCGRRVFGSQAFTEQMMIHPLAFANVILGHVKNYSRNNAGDQSAIK